MRVPPACVANTVVGLSTGLRRAKRSNTEGPASGRSASAWGSATVHCFCTKGKPAKLRQGFYWCVPATFSNSFAWTKPWVDQFLLLSPARRKHCGLVFDMRGRPWSRLESVRATQDEFRAVLEEPSLLTSYSWRRLGTTVGLLANFSVPQLAALGDWGDRISDTQAKMPVHYAGSRYALSRFCKHYAYYVASHVRDYTAWEVIPPPAVDEACRLAKDRAALAVEQDCTVVWSSKVVSRATSAQTHCCCARPGAQA